MVDGPVGVAAVAQRGYEEPPESNQHRLDEVGRGRMPRLLAVVVVTLTFPMYERLAKRLGGRPNLAATGMLGSKIRTLGPKSGSAPWGRAGAARRNPC